MSSKRKIIGYDKSGAPIYEGDQLQSPMEMGDENLPPINPLPEDESQMSFDQLQSMNGVNDRMDQLIASGMSPEEAAHAIQGMGADLPSDQQAPQSASTEPEVRRAEPSLKPTGAQMDLSFIEQLNNAPDDDTFKQMVQQLDPVQRHIYDRSYGYKQVTPAWAAQQAENFYKMQDERQKLAEDPVKQAQLADRNSKITERQAVQNDFAIRRKNTIKNIEEILADPDYSSLVGPVDGTVGRAYDSAFNQKAQAKRAKLDRLINIDVLDMTKYLRPISQDELKYLRTLVPGQTQHWEVYKQYLGEKLDMLKQADKAVVNPATNQPLPSEDGQSAPQPQPNVYQQSQQNPAIQLRSQLESSDTLTLPNGRVLKKVKNADGSIGWSE